MRPSAFALVSGAILVVTSGAAHAQDLKAFDRWGADLGRQSQPCPLVAPTLPQQNAYFGFNGNHNVPGFDCRQVGPFYLNNAWWFVQNVKGLQPNGPCQNFGPNCRIDSVRLCSTSYVGSTTPVYGPFGGLVGSKGCEKLWAEEVKS
jgi:hypothetical protein